MIRKTAVVSAILLVLCLVGAGPAAAQAWFNTGTGLGVSKAKVAVPDMAVRSAAAQPLEKTFHDVLWSDLEYSGILDLVSTSFYPTQIPSQPSELKAAGLVARARQRLYGGVRESQHGRVGSCRFAGISRT